jgi:hypothetical protein
VETKAKSGWERRNIRIKPFRSRVARIHCRSPSQSLVTLPLPFVRFSDGPSEVAPADVGAGYAFMILANVAGTGGGVAADDDVFVFGRYGEWSGCEEGPGMGGEGDWGCTFALRTVVEESERVR